MEDNDMSQNNENTAHPTTEQLLELVNQRLRLELPEPIYSETSVKDVWIEMSDGVKLFANLCLPEGSGKWPVIIMRNPYQSNDPADNRNSQLLGRRFAQYGYAFLYCHARGIARSEGDFLPFVNERTDGRDTIDWVAKQDWCDGNIGCYGASYLGHVQWSIADYHHPALKTLFISVFGINSYNTFYRRGMFRQDPWTEWACQMMEANRYKSHEEKAEQVRKGLEVFPQAELGKQLTGDDCDWYNTWITNISETDPYWASGFWGELTESLSNIEIPLFLHGGWFDVFIRTQIESWRALPEETRRKSRFVVGPWHHGGAPSGDLDYPNEARFGLLQIREALEWFDFQLKGKPYQSKLGVIEAYSIGDNQWKVWENDICPETEEVYYLTPDNKLTNSSVSDGEISFTYDPQNPTKVLSFGLAKGSVFHPEPGTREGVVSFISDPLTEELYLVGKIQAELYVSSSASATAFAINILETFEDGKSVNIIEDITDIRWRGEREQVPYTPNSIVKLKIDVSDITWMLKKGSRLRIDISSSLHPLYHAHPNTEENWAVATERVTAKQTIYCGTEYPSKLVLPINRGY
jgi:putative CocE/NonD family hydrolase